MSWKMHDLKGIQNYLLQAIDLRKKGQPHQKNIGCQHF